ncbi:hypothetical protein BH23ACT4_BH23ACT4_10990 [soil metagenome]
MSWWVIELITDLILVALILVLGPLIKRFGRAYAGDIFRGNPRTGKSYLVLMDVAYYLIFTAYVMFTVTLSQPSGWGPNAGDPLGTQLQHEVARVGGMLLLMGVLHGLNVLSLPLVGRLLGVSRSLDEDTPAVG